MWKNIIERTSLTFLLTVREKKDIATIGLTANCNIAELFVDYFFFLNDWNAYLLYEYATY